MKRNFVVLFILRPSSLFPISSIDLTFDFRTEKHNYISYCGKKREYCSNWIYSE